MGKKKGRGVREDIFLKHGLAADGEPGYTTASAPGP